MNSIEINPIGIIRSPYHTLEEMPIQPLGAESVEGIVALETTYTEGLEDIEGFSHLILIYLFHRVRGFDLSVKPFLDDKMHGLFATRAPRRPNPIGISVVPLLRREANLLFVGNIDVLDGTPLLDIKPFVPAFDSPEATAIGWLHGKMDQAKRIRSDGRFTPRG